MYTPTASAISHGGEVRSVGRVHISQRVPPSLPTPEIKSTYAAMVGVAKPLGLCLDLCTISLMSRHADCRNSANTYGTAPEGYHPY